MGDLADDDRGHGMVIVVEYAGQSGKAQWVKPPASHCNYLRFGKTEAAREAGPDEVIEMTFAKRNAAKNGFNQRTIDDVAFSMDKPEPTIHLRQARRYRVRMRNASDDIQNDVRSAEGCCYGWRISGSDSGFCGGQSGADTVSLSSATAHGFRIHELVQLCVKIVCGEIIARLCWREFRLRRYF